VPQFPHLQIQGLLKPRAYPGAQYAIKPRSSPLLTSRCWRSVQELEEEVFIERLHMAGRSNHAPPACCTAGNIEALAGGWRSTLLHGPQARESQSLPQVWLYPALAYSLAIVSLQGNSQGNRAEPWDGWREVSCERGQCVGLNRGAEAALQKGSGTW
jgi:hypothetical protein